MGADTKSLRLRMKSVDSTLHLTKAMGLVASSKIRRANDQMMRAREYATAVKTVIEELSVRPECQKSPYMQEREGETRLVVIAGDRGLAGGYNANVFRLMKEYPDARVIPVGKRVCDRVGEATVSSEAFSYADAKALAEKLCREFAAGEFSRLGVIGTRYISMMTQEAEIRWILPLQKAGEEPKGGMIFEPGEAEVFSDAVPLYVAGVLYAAARESFASEVAARRMAMDSAGKNAEQMIEDLRLAYNRARQGAITQEITEVVAGSDI